jgi:hypothetical protein
MQPHLETSGGLIGQLRDHALKASDDGFWKEPAAQSSIINRSMKLRGNYNDFIRVEFEAKKVQCSMGKNALNTSYSLKASRIEKGLVVDFLPDNAKEVLRMKKVAAGNEQKVEIMAIDDEEIDEQEFEGYDDMQFRHVQRVEYLLDGRGSLRYCAREDVYEDDDEDGVEIIALHTIEQGSAREEESQMVSLQGWGKNVPNNCSTKFLLHPDLQKIDIETSIQELKEDIQFFTILEDYVVNKKLLRHSRLEHRQSMLTMLAFLNYSATTKDIQDLL